MTGSGSAGEHVVVRPGFVDVQVNGIDQVDFWTADAEAWTRAGRRLLRTGVTAYCPTLVTAPLDDYDAALDRVAAARDQARDEALPRIEGVHLEGPFLGGAPGAHPVALLRTMDVDWLLALLDRHPGLVRIVTIAPEADPELNGIRALAERGVIVALGHSKCSYEGANAAFDAGATLVTHLFNGMGPLHHRSPGLAGAALTRPDVRASLIADLVHVHPAMLRLALSRGGAEIVLVTDAVATDVDSMGGAVEARNGAVYLPDGTLTGSVLTMDQAVRNLVDVGVDREHALRAASTVPAALLGLPAGRADRVVLDATSLIVREVWIEGTRVLG